MARAHSLQRRGQVAEGALEDIAFSRIQYDTMMVDGLPMAAVSTAWG